MPDTFRVTLRNYLAMLVICLGTAGAALALWLFNRDVTWIGITIPLYVYFDVSLVFLISLGMWAEAAEDRDARDSCEPILRRYKRTGNVDDLLYGYELWRLDGHGMAIRIRFLRSVIELLVADGYVYEAADLLNDYQRIATTTDSIRDYRRFKKVCDRRMNAILAEAAEQERRWEAERRTEELRRERRRRQALQREEQGSARTQYRQADEDRSTQRRAAQRRA